MDRNIVAPAIEFFLDPGIRRSFGPTKDYWLELRLCLGPVPNQRKRAKILQQIGTLGELKTNIGDFAMSSQADWLLAMAYKASHDARKEDRRQSRVEVAYSFKHFLLNVLILLFAERYEIVAGEGIVFTSQPKLELKRDADNSMNLVLRFLVGYTLSRDALSQIYQQATAPQNAISFHLPRNQLIGEVAKIIKTGLKPV